MPFKLSAEGFGEDGRGNLFSLSPSGALDRLKSEKKRVAARESSSTRGAFTLSQEEQFFRSYRQGAV
jgi:hypothetical protein